MIKIFCDFDLSLLCVMAILLKVLYRDLYGEGVAADNPHILLSIDTLVRFTLK